MSRSAITALREQRAALFTQMTDLSEAAEAESRDLTGEELETYTRLEGEFDSISARAERMEREAGLAPQMTRRDAVPDEPLGDQTISEGRVAALMGRITRAQRGDEAVTELRELAKAHAPGDLRSRAQRGDTVARRLYTATDEYRDAFECYVRTLNGSAGDFPAEQRAAFAVGAGATGGFTVPVEFYNALIVRLRDFGVVRSLATTIQTSGSGDLQIPRASATRASAAWTAEAAAYTESEDSFEQIILKSYKAAVIAKASEEMIHDSAFDVLGWIANSSGEALGILENTAFEVGASGSTTTPEGLTTKGTVGVTLATGQTTTISSADSLLDLYHSVIRAYRGRASWIFNDATIKIIRKLKDTTNQYIWQPALTAGEPDTLLGRPVYADPDVPVPAANAITGIFGDIASAYLIRDVEGVNAQVLNELYAANGQVGFRVHKRTDGDLVDDAAIRTLKQSAT